MAGEVIFASEPTEGHGIGVLGALLFPNAEEGVDAFGRLDSPLGLRSG